MNYTLTITSSIGTMMFRAGTGNAVGYFVRDIFSNNALCSAFAAGRTSPGWRELIWKVRKIDLPVCPTCGIEMKVVAFVTVGSDGQPGKQ